MPGFFSTSGAKGDPQRARTDTYRPSGAWNRTPTHDYTHSAPLVLCLCQEQVLNPKLTPTWFGILNITESIF